MIPTSEPELQTTTSVLSIPAVAATVATPDIAGPTPPGPIEVLVRALGHAGGLSELVARYPGGRVIRGRYGRPDLLADDAAILNDGGEGEYFVNVNPQKDGSPHRVIDGLDGLDWECRHRAMEREVLGIINLFVDIDPVRPSKVCATPAEKEEAETLLNVILGNLHSIVPDDCYAVGDEGNRYQVVVPLVPLSPSKENAAKVKRVLRLLSECSRLTLVASGTPLPAAEIDLSVAEPSSLMRIWGTQNRTGKDLPAEGRGWRRSSRLYIPAARVPVDIDHLIDALERKVGPGVVKSLRR